MSQWSIEKVGAWIDNLAKTIDIGDGSVLKQKFIENRMDGRNLMEFTATFGVVMGIPGGDALRVEKAISNLKQGNFEIQNSSFLGDSIKSLSEQEKKHLLKKWISIQNLSELQQSRVKFLFQQFIHREEGTQKVMRASLENLSSFQKNQGQNTTTQSNNFIILSGGSGSGKTRASCEIGHILRTMETKRV